MKQSHTMKEITKRREKARMLPEDLANRADIQLRTLREIEKGLGRRLHLRVRRNLAKALKANPADLFTADGVAR